MRLAAWPLSAGVDGHPPPGPAALAISFHSGCSSSLPPLSTSVAPPPWGPPGLPPTHISSPLLAEPQWLWAGAAPTTLGSVSGPAPQPAPDPEQSQQLDPWEDLNYLLI